MKSKSNFFLFLVYLAFVCCLLPVTFFIFKHPAYNFDMLGYMAHIIRIDQKINMDQLHSVTYSQARQHVPAEEYKKLTSIPSFREKYATDASQFKKLLPIYVVKPLYLWLSWLFYKGGFSLPGATVMPSILSYLAIGLFLFHWLKKYLVISVAFLSGVLIMFSVFTVGIASLSTPDCLSALFLFLSSYFILEKRNPALMFLFFLLSIFARVDNIITCFFIISFLTVIEKWRQIDKVQYFLMLTMLAISYVCVIFPVTQFGWSILYYSQYAKHIDFSKDFDQSVSPSSYLMLVQSKLVTAIVSTHFTFFLFLGLLITGSPLSFKKFTFDQAFLVLLIAIIFFRFLLLPDLSDRFYFGFYLVIIMLLVRKFSPQNLKINNEDR